MSVLNIHGSYFSVTSPFHIMDRWFNPLRHHKTVMLNGKPLTISWTRRAERALESLNSPLTVEMQLYFSCVVKKRLIFHEQTDLETTKVTDGLQIAFRPVEALSCNPVEFARNYPVKQQFTSKSAIQMRPSKLEIDFKQSKWQGSFSI